MAASTKKGIVGLLTSLMLVLNTCKLVSADDDSLQEIKDRGRPPSGQCLSIGDAAKGHAL